MKVLLFVIIHTSQRSAFTTMIEQIEEEPPPTEDGYDPLQEESPKRGKKKRDSTTLRKAPQGMYLIRSL